MLDSSLGGFPEQATVLLMLDSSLGGFPEQAKVLLMLDSSLGGFPEQAKVLLMLDSSLGGFPEQATVLLMLDSSLGGFPEQAVAHPGMLAAVLAISLCDLVSGCQTGRTASTSTMLLFSIALYILKHAIVGIGRRVWNRMLGYWWWLACRCGKSCMINSHVSREIIFYTTG